MANKQVGEAITTPYDKGHPYFAAWSLITDSWFDSLMILTNKYLDSVPDLPDAEQRENQEFMKTASDNSLYEIRYLLDNPTSHTPPAEDLLAEAFLSARNEMIEKTDELREALKQPSGQGASKLQQMRDLMRKISRKYTLTGTGVNVTLFGVSAKFAEMKPSFTANFHRGTGFCFEENVFLGINTSPVDLSAPAIAVQLELGNSRERIRPLFLGYGFLDHMGAFSENISPSGNSNGPQVTDSWGAIYTKGGLQSMNEATAWGLGLVVGYGPLSGNAQVYYHVKSKTIVVILGAGGWGAIPARASAGGFVKVASEAGGCPADRERLMKELGTQ